jgi:hypothetical protein
MRELSFVNNQTAAPDAAVTAYIGPVRLEL